jgi:outer membrane protein assembly factor BamB
MTRHRAAWFVVLGAAAALGVCVAAQTSPGDWPQWRGPDRSGVSQETGLLKQWPSGGPPLLWSATNLGAGYGSIAVAGDRIYVQGLRGGQSIVSALSRADGKPLWSKGLGRGAENDRGSGPRGTPTIDGDRVYILTEAGDLACLRHDGTAVWQRNILKEFGARNISWLISESPLIEGNMVIVSPGGKSAGMAALDKMTGRTIWATKELNDEAGYASPIVGDVGGVRTIFAFTADAGVGVRASDGKLMFRNPQAANGTANVATPVFADNKVLFSSAYGTGAELLQLRAQNGEVRAQEVYFTRDLQNHHGGLVLVNGYVYGYHNAILTCVEFATGKTMWRGRGVGKGALVAADGHLYIVTEDQVVALVEATPAGFKEKGRFQIRDEGAPSWAHPVVSGGRLFVRNQGTLAAYDIRAR